MRVPALVVVAAAMLACRAGGDMDNVVRPGGRAVEGRPVDLAPWTYTWRADRTTQPKPEAEFIPRRLERLDRIYRTAHDALPPDQLKSIYYDMPDLLKRLPPKPRGRLLTGMLWTGGLADLQVHVTWPIGAVPDPGTVEVRSYPTSFGWFGFTVDRVLPAPTISGDGRTWTFRTDPTELMDSSYSVHVSAATEMVAIFCDAPSAAVPEVCLTSSALGTWRPAELEVEWGFGPGTDGAGRRLDPDMAVVQSVHALPPGRTGVAVKLLVPSSPRPGLEGRVTLWGKGGGITVRVADAERGPVYVPRRDLYVCRPGQPDAKAFGAELQSRDPRGIRGMTAERAETGAFEDLMKEVRLWTCPEGSVLKPFPPVPDPPMSVALSDRGWTDAWRAACNQLTGEHMWGGLAFEVARVTHAMEMVGLHPQADKIYQHFLSGPGAKPDGDYSDGKGALEWATSMRHDMGYSHDGTHASTGRLLFSMAERYFLTGDKQWLAAHRERLQAAADWIIRQRRGYIQGTKRQDRLGVAGLLPPCMLGDYAIPSCDWHWYYVDNALAVQGLQRLGDALAELDRRAGERYQAEAAAFRKDLRKAVEMDASLSPVRLGRDGAYHTYLPRMAYMRGLTGPELGAPQFPDTDLWMGSLPLAEQMAGLHASDPIIVDTLDVMEEMAITPAAVKEKAEGRAARGLNPEDAWRHMSYSILPKASHTANIYLLQDDIPNFLRFWANSYASMVGADGKLWEHSHLGNFDACGAPDNGTAGWFLESFRNMLVMEEGQYLWIARGAPRPWLAQGKRIAVSNAPTWFGTLAYEISSDVDHGRITATIQMPTRSPARSILLRLRHPSGALMKSVTVNGKPWRRFEPEREIVRVSGLRGEVTVVADY